MCADARVEHGNADIVVDREIVRRTRHRLPRGYLRRCREALDRLVQGNELDALAVLEALERILGDADDAHVEVLELAPGLAAKSLDAVLLGLARLGIVADDDVDLVGLRCIYKRRQREYCRDEDSLYDVAVVHGSRPLSQFLGVLHQIARLSGGAGPNPGPKLSVNCIS